jgi:hypothetical protein
MGEAAKKRNLIAVTSRGHDRMDCKMRVPQGAEIGVAPFIAQKEFQKHPWQTGPSVKTRIADIHCGVIPAAQECLLRRPDR